jgi:hypothetical protein
MAAWQKAQSPSKTSKGCCAVASSRAVLSTGEELLSFMRGGAAEEFGERVVGRQLQMVGRAALSSGL